MALTIPSHMRAILYKKAQEFEIVNVPIPEPKSHEVLIKVKSCGICGTDVHIHDGNFQADMPVITGHETSGTVVKFGADVEGFAIGDSVTADNSELCGHCHYCRRGQSLYCENFRAHGLHLNGGLAEFCTFSAAKLFRFHKATWEEASLFEAAACAVHGVERIGASAGSVILVLGAGPTGLCLAQLLRLNGGAHVVVASNAGSKMDMARSLNVADEYIDFDRVDPSLQWSEIKEKHPYGFDVVLEATGSLGVLEKAVDCCTRGGTLLMYGVYGIDAVVKLDATKIFQNELTIKSSFSHMWCLPRSVQYIESGKLNVRGLVTHKYSLDEFKEALEAIRSKKCVKATIMMA